jgi:hypothetical protein
MKNAKMSVVAASAIFGTMLISSAASAMPVTGLAAAVSELSADIQNVHLVCGPYGCLWRPSYYYWRPHYRYWGYRGYRRWW